jgi:hypothetical protein
MVGRIIQLLLLAAVFATGYLLYERQNTTTNKETPHLPAQPPELPAPAEPHEAPAQPQPQAPVHVPAPPTQQPTQAAEPKKVSEPATRMVTITNAITQKMTTYHKGIFGSFTPKFRVEINDTPVDMGKQVTVAAPNNQIDVKYHYNFLNGYRVGWHTIRVTLPPKGDKFTLTFSWKAKDRHVIVDGAVGYASVDHSPK